MAWLQATPDKKPDKEPPPKSRWQQLEDRKSALVALPEIKSGGYLLSWLDELGWYSIGGMGSPIPLSWTDIDSWARVTQTNIDSDDALLIRHLSKLFVGKFSEAKDPSCPAPFADRAKINQDVLREQFLSWTKAFPKDYFNNKMPSKK